MKNKLQLLSIVFLAAFLTGCACTHTHRNGRYPDHGPNPSSVDAFFCIVDYLLFPPPGVAVAPAPPPPAPVVVVPRKHHHPKPVVVTPPRKPAHVHRPAPPRKPAHVHRPAPLRKPAARPAPASKPVNTASAVPVTTSGNFNAPMNTAPSNRRR